MAQLSGDRFQLLRVERLIDSFADVMGKVDSETEGSGLDKAQGVGSGEGVREEAEGQLLF